MADVSERRLRLEFLVEPLTAGSPGPHVDRAVRAVEELGLDVELGPFASQTVGGSASIAEALAKLIGDAFDHGATRVSAVVDLADVVHGGPSVIESTLGAAVSEPTTIVGALDTMIAQVEADFDEPLAGLDRRGKQRVVGLLHERGAFALRRSIDGVAAALGVSRITIYNYLNALEDPADNC